MTNKYNNYENKYNNYENEIVYKISNDFMDMIKSNPNISDKQKDELLNNTMDIYRFYIDITQNNSK